MLRLSVSATFTDGSFTGPVPESAGGTTLPAVLTAAISSTAFTAAAVFAAASDAAAAADEAAAAAAVFSAAAFSSAAFTAAAAAAVLDMVSGAAALFTCAAACPDVGGTLLRGLCACPDAAAAAASAGRLTRAPSGLAPSLRTPLFGAVPGLTPAFTAPVLLFCGRKIMIGFFFFGFACASSVPAFVMFTFSGSFVILSFPSNRIIDDIQNYCFRKVPGFSGQMTDP